MWGKKKKADKGERDKITEWLTLKEYQPAWVYFMPRG